MHHEPRVTRAVASTTTTATSSPTTESHLAMCQTKQLLIRSCREFAERLGKQAEALMAALDDEVAPYALYLDTVQAQEKCVAYCQLLDEHLAEHGC